MGTLTSVLGFVSVATLLAPSAHASGYLAARFGADDGTPAVANPFALYYNPAAMGGMKGTKITLDGTLAIRNVEYTRPNSALSPGRGDAIGNAQYESANTGRASLSNLAVLPFAGVASDLGGSNFRLGFASYVPFGGSASWDKVGSGGVPGAEDGPQRWHNIEGSIRALYNTLGFAYVLPGGRVSVGGSVSGILHSIRTVRARNIDSSDATANIMGSDDEGRTTVEASGMNLGAAIGLYWVAVPGKMTIGASYTSQPGFGDTRMSGTLKANFPGIGASTTDVDFIQTYPDVVRLGSTLKISQKTELRFDTSYTRWSVFKDQCVVIPGKDCTLNDDGSDASGGSNVVANVPRRWKDAVGLRIGGVHTLNETFALHASAATSTPAVRKDTMDASTIDSLRLYGTLGGWYTMNEHIRIGASYTYLYFVPVNISADEAQQTKWKGASKGPSAAGAYTSNVGLLNVNATYTF